MTTLEAFALGAALASLAVVVRVLLWLVGL